MVQSKILDKLYSIRWCLNETPAKVDGAKILVTELIDELTGKKPDEPAVILDPKDPETPSIEDHTKATLVVVVGHEKKAPGADFVLGGSEYQYNSDIAQRMIDFAARKYPNLKVVKIFRDGIGISGAYRKAAGYNPDCCLELHFNAFNGVASGSETLCSMNSEDKKFAAIVHGKICEVFERLGRSRGVRVLARGDRGGQTCYSLPGTANCLPEPFFGDNAKEAKLADEKRGEYAIALVEAAVEWIKEKQSTN